MTPGVNREHGVDQCQPDLEDRRAAAWALPAEPVRRRDLAVHDPAPSGLHPGTDQGRGLGRIQEAPAPRGRAMTETADRIAVSLVTDPAWTDNGHYVAQALW